MAFHGGLPEGVPEGSDRGVKENQQPTAARPNWITKAELIELTGWNVRTVTRRQSSGKLESRIVGTGKNGKAVREYNASSLLVEFQTKRLQQAAYRYPRTGAKRKAQRPLWIDQLSQAFKDAIIEAREEGKTWNEISLLASELAGKRIPRETLRRWYDLRVRQQDISSALREIISLLKSIKKAVSR